MTRDSNFPIIVTVSHRKKIKKFNLTVTPGARIILYNIQYLAFPVKKVQL